MASSRIANEYGPRLAPWQPEPVQESEYVPAREIVLGQDGTVEYRENVARTDGTFHSSGKPGTAGLYVEDW